MSSGQASKPALQKPLRLWPGVVAVLLQWLAWCGAPIVVPGAIGGYISVLGGFLGGLWVVVWWAFLSGGPRSERWGGVALLILAPVAASRVLHESIATGLMGMMYPIYAVPVLSLAFVVWAAGSRGLSGGPRRVAMVTTILLASGVWLLVRSDGITGDGSGEFAWRWAETHEERFMAGVGVEPPPHRSERAALEAPAEWPGFRGPGRDGIVAGVRIETDWTAAPPAELWRRPVGPGVSSFAIQGDLLYTQEQHGDDEVVASYRVATGEAVWVHRDTARFWDSHAGAGPRATPTLSEGRVYTLGATGIVNALDSGDGSIVWSRNAASDTNTVIPYWGFAGSPLVVDDIVVVAVAGSLVGYDIDTGEPRWFGPDGGDSYSSPHRLTIDGVEQVLLMSQAGATSVSPDGGKLLWKHSWRQGTRIVQPSLTSDGGLLISAGDGIGLRRIEVTQGTRVWTIDERWTSNRLKPYFNDFLVHEGHAFGFDGSILACIDVEHGERKWKGGRYGHGQLLLLADQDLLLVLSETGELALVAAAPHQFRELARFPAIRGKTWNHPALVGDMVLLRNGEEMAAYQLSPARG